MSRTIPGWIAAALLCATSLYSAQGPADSPNGSSSRRALVNRYCVTCHNEKLKTAQLMLERYISAAGKVSRLAVGDPTTRPAFDTYQVPQLLAQESRVSEDLPFGSRGGTAVRHYFPLDGEYVIKVRLQRNPTTLAIIGL